MCKGFFFGFFGLYSPAAMHNPLCSWNSRMWAKKYLKNANSAQKFHSFKRFTPRARARRVYAKKETVVGEGVRTRCIENRLLRGISPPDQSRIRRCVPPAPWFSVSSLWKVWINQWLSMKSMKECYCNEQLEFFEFQATQPKENNWVAYYKKKFSCNKEFSKLLSYLSNTRALIEVKVRSRNIFCKIPLAVALTQKQFFVHFILCSIGSI